MTVSRRAFLAGCAGCLASRRPYADLQRHASTDPSAAVGFPNPAQQVRGDSSLAAAIRAGRIVGPPPIPPTAGCNAPFVADRVGTLLRHRYRDPRRHFVFEYYPWYGTDPWFHWNQWDREPPVDIAATSFPLLGPYDSRSTKVLERHAEWIAKSGVGAVNLSWWGPKSFSNGSVTPLMDVFRAHDIHVTFHIEPYRNDRAAHLVSDVLYLLKEYGEKRRWDAFLFLENADGSQGPVFKTFRTLLPRQITDCHGIVRTVPDYTPNDEWRRQVETLRELLRQDFDHLTLLADSPDSVRARQAGFDGIAIYDNFLEPGTWAGFAAVATEQDMVFSFNTNPGFDSIARRNVAPDSCYRPRRFEPKTSKLDWSSIDDRARAHRLSERRITESLQETLRLQTDPCLSNSRKGFLLVYVNSFNEWHEGHQFEPMKSRLTLSPAERRQTYHNAVDGPYRLRVLGEELRGLIA